MARIIMVRHGATEMNDKGLYGGWLDLPMSQKGREQAKIVAKKLENERIDRIISSDLHRAVETAECINKTHKLEHRIRKDLREMNFGLWEGMHYNHIKEQYSQEFLSWQKDWVDYKVPEGESFRQMYDRTIRALTEILEEYKDLNILVVSHGGCIRAMLAHLIGRGIGDYWKYKIENCGITKIEIEDGFAILEALNQ